MIKCVTIIQIEFEFGNFGFCGDGKTGVPGEKPLGARTKTSNKLNPHIMPTLSRNRASTTLVGGESSHHRAILVPL